MTPHHATHTVNMQWQCVHSGPAGSARKPYGSLPKIVLELSSSGPVRAWFRTPRPRDGYIPSRIYSYSVC